MHCTKNVQTEYMEAVQAQSMSFRGIFFLLCPIFGVYTYIIEVMVFQKQCHIAKPATVYFMSGLGRENNIAV